MKYVLLIRDDQSVVTAREEAAAVDRSAKAWDHKMAERGVLVQAQRPTRPSKPRPRIRWRGAGPSRSGSAGKKPIETSKELRVVITYRSGNNRLG